jgi:TatD DNase family protein
MKIRLIDSHCHLNLPEFENDLDKVIKRAKENGIFKVVVVGINRKTNEKALFLAKKYQNFVLPVVGFHPHEVKDISEEDYALLENQLKYAYALGEVGLDWVKEYSPKNLQFEHLEKQLELAKKYKKPVVLHLRGDENFWKQALSFLKNFSFLKLLFHCFTGNKEIAKKVLDLGGWISIPGIVTFKNAELMREAVKYIPLEKLLIETDAPFLAPHPFRGKRNEPAFVFYVAQKIAEIKEIPFEEVAEKTTKNALSFFNL